MIDAKNDGTLIFHTHPILTAHRLQHLRELSIVLAEYAHTYYHN